MRHAAMLAAVLVAAGAAWARAEPDWFTRVREQGLGEASRIEVERHGRGVLPDSLHVGECYYRTGRAEEGLAVFRRLLRSPDRNYAAAARARVGEGLFRLGRTAEARSAFVRCLEEHPDAWLDGSVPDLCRAWLRKIDGELTPLGPPEPADPLGPLRREVEELERRIAELTELIRRLSGD